MPSTPLAENRLTHPPIALLNVVTSTDNEVPWIRLKKGSLKLRGDGAVMSRCKPFSLFSMRVLLVI